MRNAYKLYSKFQLSERARRSILIFPLTLVLAISGCLVGPNYKRPATTPPDKFYMETSVNAASIADLPWWEIFKDPQLQGLIQEALKNNYDVRIAAARVEQAREELAIAHSQFYPQIGYGASITGQRSPNTKTGTYYAYSFPVSWEIDFWGRIRRLNEEQRALLLATEEARRVVFLSLVSDVAQAYFELRALDEQLVIAKETTQSFQATYDLFSKKFEGGAASALDTSRAEGALANVAAQIPDFERQILAKENQISLLLGKNPGPIARGATLQDQNDMNDVPAGLPSTLLERRPDVRQAEEQLIAANAEIGVQRANYFPTIGLSGVFGGTSITLEQLVGAGVTWGLGGVANGPLYTGGRLKAQLRAAYAARDQAELVWQQTLTSAFGDVSTSLNAHKQFAESLREQTRSVNAYRESVRLSTIRYQSGFASYFEILDAQLQLYPAETFRVTYELSRKVSLVNIYRSLGGGWKLADADWSNPSSNNAAPSPTTIPTPPAATPPAKPN
jgi:outer membrane protein, multidrug efflux system